jgi:CheY-like chemotaxis protein
MNDMKSTLDMPEAKPQPKATKSVKSRLLLADDDPAVRRMLLRLLVEEGYAVLTAADGVEAVNLARATKFDLVLLDLNMPVKDGWEAFEEISTRDPLLPFILITARPNQLFPALASGVGALMEKPLDFVKLLATIESLLQEPMEIRRARSAGQSAVFSYIPPAENRQERRT